MIMRLFYFVILFIFSFTCAYLIGNYTKDDINSIDDTIYTPEYKFNDGDEIALIYITSAYCRFSTSPEMPELIERAKLRARDEAIDNGANFAAIGVVVDWNVKDGFNHLSKFGEFDEVMVGRNWFNTGARKFIYADTTIERGSVPQLVIVSRVNDIQVNETRNIYNIKEQNIVARFRGADEIKEYANNQ